MNTRRCARWSVAAAFCIASGLLMTTSPALADNLDQQAKAFAPSAGKAAVYVYRQKKGNGRMAYPPDVIIDGRNFGSIGRGQYYWLEVQPGEHEVWVGLEHGAGPHGHITLIPINAQVGQSYFVRAKTTQNRDKHVAVDAATGKAELLACCTLGAAEKNSSPVFR